MNTSSSRRRVHPGLVILATATALLSLSVGGPLAQSVQAHLNPVIDKLARGELVFGVSTGIFFRWGMRGRWPALASTMSTSTWNTRR